MVKKFGLFWTIKNDDWVLCSIDCDSVLRKKVSRLFVYI